MDFLDIFSAQNDCLVIGYLMDTKIFCFWPFLSLWRKMTETTPGVLKSEEIGVFTYVSHVLE